MPRTISGAEKWRSSERIAARVLEDNGFNVVEEHKRITVEGLEIGEIDLLAEKDGEVYAVEVKAGRLDVGGVRQAYVNALLAGAKPMVVCKGFADPSAEALAEKLGVKVLKLSDVFLVEHEELEALVREAVERVMEEYLTFLLAPPPELGKEDEKLLEALASSPSAPEAADKLGLDVPELARAIDRARGAGILPKWARRYSSARRAAILLLAKKRFAGLLEAAYRRA